LAAVKIDPNNLLVKMNLGKAYASSEQLDNAKTIYLEILQKDNKYWDAYIEIAKVLTALKDTASAEGYLLTLQSKNPSYREKEVNVLLSNIRS
jgi:tetratricopeptide (TPR) repeat protein